MADVNWRRAVVSASIVLALMLLCGSLYLHLKQKPHLGRLMHRTSVQSDEDIEEAENSNSAEPVDPAGIGQMVINDTEYSAYNQEYYEESPSASFWATESLVVENEGPSLSDDTPQEESASNEVPREFSDPHLYGSMMKLFTKLEGLLLVDNQHNASVMNALQQSIAESALEVASDWKLTAPPADHQRHVTEACMQCICETTTQCQPAMCDTPCGLYRISYPYWLEAGELQLEGDHCQLDVENETPLDLLKQTSYAHCVNNAYCAARTVSAYIHKNALDCNKDGIIDCRDHIALHILGSTDCMRHQLSPVFESRMQKCLANFQ